MPCPKVSCLRASGGEPADDASKPRREVASVLVAQSRNAGPPDRVHVGKESLSVLGKEVGDEVSVGCIGNGVPAARPGVHCLVMVQYRPRLVGQGGG